MKNQLVLVDADSLIYLAGIAGQETTYHAVFEDSEGNVTSGRFEKAADVKQHIADNELTLLERETVIEPLPVEYSLHVVKSKLREIQKRYGKRMRVYIKGPEGKNFRDEIYTVQKYKGNRQTPKPLHYDAIVEYMVDTWGAIRIEGKEVDDHLALEVREASLPCVVCSPDKDLDQIPGLHWNYGKAVEYTIDEFEARIMFWTQVLMGDSADNIMGCWKVGEGKAKKLMLDEGNVHLDDEMLWSFIVEQYELSQEHPTCPYKDMNPYDVALQTARAVWMQNERNRMWTPPGVAPEYMDIEEERWDG